MRGSVDWQITELFKRSGINRIGSSKHEAKQAARGQGARTWAQIGRSIGIHSYATAKAYQDVWRALLEHAKSQHGVKDIERLTPPIVASYLEEKTKEGVAHATFQQYAAAVGKLETALNMYSEKFGRGNVYDWREAVDQVRGHAHRQLARFDDTRAYQDPRTVIAALKRPEHQLAARIQLESGVRIREAALVKPGQLKGLKEDRVTGELKGSVLVRGKGGKMVQAQMSPETYRALDAHIREHGQFWIQKGAYRDALKDAARRTGQPYQGSHGLRWNFAQMRSRELEQRGLTNEQAEAQVSQEMGHERTEITGHYRR